MTFFTGTSRLSSSAEFHAFARNAFRPQIIKGFATKNPRRISRNLITKRFASSGILLFGFPSSTSTAPTLTSCSNVLEKQLCTKTAEQRHIIPLARSGWIRSIHSSRTRSEKVPVNKDQPTGPEKQSPPTVNLSPEQSTESSSNRPTSTAHGTHASLQEHVNHPEPSGYFHLPHLPHLPKLPHRPTKEELLAAATGFWSRLRVRFKWFSIRSLRPWNVDDWSAFVSWFLVGHIVWILLGTTTFFSLLILGINTVVAQETLARWVGDYLTRSAGVKIVFENAIVPKWGDGVITFRNVFVSRRPGQGKSKVRKGSSMDAAAAAAAERQAEANKTRDGDEEQDDGNYSQFDVTIDTVNVTLSFLKWWNGKGLLRDVEVKGVRGVVDRTSVRWPKEYIDPRTYKHEHNVGDFEIDNFKLEDLLITIHQPGGFRPFAVSIFSCDLPQLRKQWLFYDILSANQMSGSFDGSLFNIHPRQTPSPMIFDESGLPGEPSPWKKHSRLRIDGLKIDHLNRGVDGPFGWIHEGDVDIVSDIMFPVDDDESITKVMTELYDRFESTLSSHIHNPRTTQRENGTFEDDEESSSKASRDDKKHFVVMDVRVHLNNVRAAVPIFTRDLSYINSALIRPIVAYINSRKTFIPINCRIVKRTSDFDGSWTIFDSGLMEDLSAETYEAFAKDVVDSQARIRRLKKVGFWSLSVAAQALFMGLAGNIA